MLPIVEFSSVARSGVTELFSSYESMAGIVGPAGTTRIGLQSTLGLALAKGKTIAAGSRPPETGETDRPGVIGMIGTTDQRLQRRSRQ